MSATKASILDGQREMDAAIVALNKLISPQQENKQNLFRDFQTQLVATDHQTQVIRDHLATLKDQGRDYFSAWDREIRGLKTEEIKRVDTRRRDQAKASFDRIYQEVDSTKNAFRPMMTTLFDIESYLKSDLSSTNLERMRPLVLRTSNEADTVKKHVRAVLAEIDHVWLGLAQRTK